MRHDSLGEGRAGGLGPQLGGGGGMRFEVLGSMSDGIPENSNKLCLGLQARFVELELSVPTN